MNPTIRYGIVGCGMMGVEHIRNIAAIPEEQGARVVAVADPHPPSLEAARREVEAAWGQHCPLQLFTDHLQLVHSGLCDAVVVASPNMTHAAIVTDILQQKGLQPPHLLVEKPLCTTVEDCGRVMAAASHHPSVVVQVGLEYRYIPTIANLIKEVRSGSIGRVRMVAIREHRFPFLVKVHNWNRFNRNSGGTLVEKCCHFFDLMNVIVGARPARVMASGAQDVNHLEERYDGEVPDILDNAFVIVEYENGARGSLDLCMFAEGSRNEQEISVVGDKGKAEALVPEGIVRIGLRDEGRTGVKTVKVQDPRIRYQGLHHGSSYLEHLEFLQKISTSDRISAASLEDGLLSVAVGVAAQRSIETGTPVGLGDVLHGDISGSHNA